MYIKIDHSVYLFFVGFLNIWLCWVLVAACGIFLMACGVFSCSMWTLSCSMRDLVAWPGIEPRLPTLGVPRLSHWTTGVVPTVSICECLCTPSFSALLMIKPKEWTLSACVEDTQHFPANIFHHKNHSRRALTWETGYFCPAPFPHLLSGFLLGYFLHFLNI